MVLRRRNWIDWGNVGLERRIGPAFGVLFQKSLGLGPDRRYRES
jgi:hypothetical protein